MEMAGIDRENYPPIATNDSKALRKLSLLEARMVGMDTESRDASLPPIDGSRGSENNSNNSRSTIGFGNPQPAGAPSPSRGGIPLQGVAGRSQGAGAGAGSGTREAGAEVETEEGLCRGVAARRDLKRKPISAARCTQHAEHGGGCEPGDPLDPTSSWGSWR
ncbi:unnamed protein product [Discosporangium mesarthrocarpum]